MTSSTDARFEFAQDLIKEAGRIATAYFNRGRDLSVSSKGLQDVVTNADREIEELIRARIRERFPEDCFFGEETGPEEFDEQSRVWIVDPIDGTQPFISGLSDWCITIAFVEAMELRFGLVLAPARGELFTGGQGRPALLNGAPITPHPGATLADGITAVGHSPRVATDCFLPVMGGVLRAGGMFYRSGSGALMLCDVAAGRLLGYVEVQINSWDCLGAVAVLRANGHATNDLLASVEAILAGGPIAVGNTPEVYDTLAELVSAGPCV